MARTNVRSRAAIIDSLTRAQIESVVDSPDKTQGRALGLKLLQDFISDFKESLVKIIDSKNSGNLHKALEKLDEACEETDESLRELETLYIDFPHWVDDDDSDEDFNISDNADGIEDFKEQTDLNIGDIVDAIDIIEDELIALKKRASRSQRRTWENLARAFSDKTAVAYELLENPGMRLPSPNLHWTADAAPIHDDPDLKDRLFARLCTHAIDYSLDNGPAPTLNANQRCTIITLALAILQSPEKVLAKADEKSIKLYYAPIEIEFHPPEQQGNLTFDYFLISDDKWKKKCVELPDLNELADESRINGYVAALFDQRLSICNDDVSRSVLLGIAWAWFQGRDVRTNEWLSASDPRGTRMMRYRVEEPSLQLDIVDGQVAYARYGETAVGQSL